MARAIFFDAAGTLFEPREPAGVSYARIAAQFGMRADRGAVVAAFHREFARAPALAFGPGRTASDLRRLERQWWHELVRSTFAGLGRFSDFEAYFDVLFAFFGDPANWRIDPEAPPLLGRLKEAGLGLGVISNFDHRIYRILDDLGLRAHFDSVTISSEAGFAKPSPEIFRIALAKHSSSPDETIHVGDSERLDSEGAAAAGMAAALLDHAYHGPVRLDGRRARISSLASVAEVAQGFGLA